MHIGPAGVLRAASLLVLFLLATHCGGPDLASRQRGPALDMRAAMSGQWQGRATLFDRDGGLREFVLRQRNCGPRPAGLAGSCQEKAQYLYSGREESTTLQWSAEYQGDFLANVTFTRSGHTQKGDLVGSVAALRGRTGTPLDQERSVAVRTLLSRLPDDSLLEIEDFSFLGISMGRMVTQWQTQSSP